MPVDNTTNQTKSEQDSFCQTNIGFCKVLDVSLLVLSQKKDYF